jgi:hypothetical protein
MKLPYLTFPSIHENLVVSQVAVFRSMKFGDIGLASGCF